MKTLVVYYSKTGTTKKVAQAMISALNCDFDEITYDANNKTFKSSKNPVEYEQIFILSPIWAFTLATPMKLYLQKHGASVKNYILTVTCGGLGLSGCVRYCKKSIGRPPLLAFKLKDKDVKSGNFDVKNIVSR